MKNCYTTGSLPRESAMRRTWREKAEQPGETEEQSRCKVDYRPPQLSEWGSIEQLTAGTLPPGSDGPLGSSTS